MAKNLTLMAVHAHPDDEASSTGGVLARYSGEGVRTVVVTCTNGEFGDTPGGVKPGSDGHDEQEVAQIRLAELRESVKHLGVTDLELLGYHDSGMPEWEYKDRPEAFCNVPQDVVAGRIAGLIERYQPQVVISYDPDGGYQHPDHVHAARSRGRGRGQHRHPGQDVPDRDAVQPLAGDVGGAARGRRGHARLGRRDQPGNAGPDAGVGAADHHGHRHSAVLDRKRAALLSHASQISESWFSKIPPEVAERVFGEETFIRAVDRTGAPVPETDLFAGLR